MLDDTAADNLIACPGPRGAQVVGVGMESIGRFEIRRTLGRGAQSVVYLGFDPSLQREVALKTLRLSTREEARHLMAEARAMGGLRHANIVPVYEAGEENGQPHLVFEYVPGGTVADRIQRGPAPPEEAVAILLPVLDALAHAHDQGLVHRDVKPSNILLSADGSPRLMDFGVAVKLAGAGPDDETRGLAGTPAYMAPEYIDERTIGPANDIFAAGLVLFELLAGRRAVTERDIYRTLYRIAHEDLRLPAELDLPERLVDVVHKALARDPGDRWQTMREFSRALESAMSPPVGDDVATTARGHEGTLEFLMRRIRLKGDFPALSGSIRAVNRIAGCAETESNAMLSSIVLKDVALTNKILRLVNSALFRHAGGPVSTVSRAVMILGFETVRSLAVALLLFENMQSRAQADTLRDEFVRAMMAAVMARQLGPSAGLRGAEEAFLCALFRNLGRMLALFYFPDEAREVRRLMRMERLQEEQAAIRVIGVSYPRLGVEIARGWGFPEQIVQSQRRLDAGPIPRDLAASARMGALAALSDDLVCVIAEHMPVERNRQLTAIVARYGAALGLSRQQVDDAFDRSLALVTDYAATFNLNLARTALGDQIGRWRRPESRLPQDAAALPDPGVTTLPNGLPEQGIDASLNGTPGGLPDNATSILAAGIQDISNALVGDHHLNDVLRMTLETMYRGIGFRRVVLAIRDARTNGFQARMGLGDNLQALTQKFRFCPGHGRDVFDLVLDRGVDLLITDISDARIRHRIPDWLTVATDARTFVLFPLLVRKQAVGLIYAEQAPAGGIVIPERELGMLRTLRNQAVLALRL